MIQFTLEAECKDMLQLYDLLQQFTSQLGGMDDVIKPVELGAIKLKDKVVGLYKIETYEKVKKTVNARTELRKRMRGE